MVKINWEKILKTDITFLKNQLKELKSTNQSEKKILIIQKIIDFWQNKLKQQNEKK